jgi:hypothetical protein
MEKNRGRHATKGDFIVSINGIKYRRGKRLLEMLVVHRQFE